MLLLDFRRASFWGVNLRLLLLLLLAGPTAQAANFYWVGGTGNWSDLSHWATGSGGTTTHTQVPQDTDNVIFDANSFTVSGQTVTVRGTVTCQNMSWAGAVHLSSSGTTIGGMRLTGSGIVEVNGDLKLAAGLGQQAVNFRLLAATTGHQLDLQSVPLNGWLSFENEAGSWTFVSDANLVQYGATPSLLLTAGSIDFGNATISCFGVRSTGARARTIRLNNSRFNLLAPVNSWETTGTNMTLDAGTSFLQLGNAARATANGYSFVSTAQTYNVLEVKAGASAALSVDGSVFNKLLLNGNTTLTSAAAITSTLSVGREAVLRAAGGQTIAFASQALLVTSGDCGGLASIQSSVPGRAAIFQRTAGWGGTSFHHAAVQDITFSGGGAQAADCLNRGNNQGVAFTALPVRDLYWVGGSGTWHDASHWASTSGGSSAGNTCLPTLATNVHFDANSFATSGQAVTLDGTNAFCRDLDWTGAKASVFSTATTDLSQKQLGIGGSLTLVPGVACNLQADLVFYGYETAAAATMTTAGQPLLGNVYFRAPGSTYTLLDGLTLAPGATSPNGRLYVEAGTLNTNNQLVVAQGFTSGYAATASVFTTGSGAGGPVSAAAVTVLLGSSVLTLTPSSAASDVGTRTSYTWDVATGVTLDAGTSTLLIGSNATRNQPASFRAGLGLRYHVVTFTDAAAQSLPTVVSGGGAVATFDRLTFSGSANVSASNAFTEQLELAAGRIYNFYNSTQTFGANAQLVTGNDCSSYVTINGGTGTARVTFSKPAGSLVANQVVRYAVVRNAKFTGGSLWEASQSFDRGGNSGITFTSPPIPRTLYWVGGTGRWSDANHWALSSGSSGGVCAPNQLDEVVFDSQSFTATGQVVTQDAVQAACHSLSWATVQYVPTFSGVVANQLTVYGSLTWSPAMSQLLLGETQLLDGGTLTSAGQPFGGGLTIEVPNAVVTLADALSQPRTGGSGLTLMAGTLLTNDQPVQLRSLLSAPLAGVTTPPARSLLLGASIVEITAGAWTLSQAASLTLDAGTSTIYLNTGSAFNGGDFAYNIVQTGASAAHTVGGGSTIATLQLAGDTQVTGSNTITQLLTLEPGFTYQFEAGTTTALTAGATVQANGTGASVITLQSITSGQAFSWTKPAGIVCASYIYLRDCHAQGGAYFETGQQANNQGNTTGWSFASLPQAAYRSQQVCPQTGAHPLRFTFTGLDRLTQQAVPLAAAQFPLTLVLRNLTTGTTETLAIPSATYDYVVPASSAATQYQVVSVATNSSNCTPLLNGGAFPIVTDAPLSGLAGQWTGAGTTSDWFDCQNWASGTVPTATTDVTVGPSPAPPVLNAAGAVVNTLRVLSGGELTLGSAAELALKGDWLNNGTATAAAGSLVSFVGSGPQTIARGSFGRVVVDNAAGLVLQTDASSATSLVLTAGVITTGSNKWVHSNAAGNSLRNTPNSYVAGTLRRALAAGGSDTYTFPVGLAGQYARLDLVSNQLTGTQFLDASFGPKTDPDTGLSCTESSPSALRYVAVHAAGCWTLSPDNQPTGGTYAVRAYLAPFPNLTDNLFGILKRPDVSVSAADWNTGGGTLSPANGDGRRVADGYALRSSLSSFSQFGLGQAVTAAPLPVTLVSFRAVLSGPGVLLTWTVAQELGISRYEVERSLDGRSFQQVGQVVAKGSKDYSFTDTFTKQFADNQQLYYRLRLIEPGAPTVYSPVVALRTSALTANLMVWPTVFSRELHIDSSSLSEDLQRLEIIDARGQVVYTQPLLPGTRSATLSGHGLTGGLYLLRAATATHLYQLRVVRE